ncbi:MAG: sugar ABC transporter permease [Firmicutes bacterium]|nr:sugar ABC transporter permease [Bacillota bacterium]
MPSILGILIWLVGPMIYSIWLSLTKWDIITPAKYVGLGNFKKLFLNDTLFWKSLWVTFYYTIVAVPLNLVAGFLVALLLNTKVKGMNAFRTIFYLPSIVPQVANAMLWLWLLNPEFGLVNTFLRSLGFPKVLWLQDERWVMPAFWVMGLWTIGGGMLIYLAGLQGIPEQLYEAAEIDGASVWAKFWHITIPQMSPIIFFNLIMGIIGSFQIFTSGFLMTNGGPNNATLFYVLYLYRNAFEWLNMGYAAALAWVLFVIILLLTLLIFRSLGDKVYYDDVR